MRNFLESCLNQRMAALSQEATIQQNGEWHMSDNITDLHEKARGYAEKYNDPELQDFMLSVSHELEEAELLRHHFGYFVMHAQAILPHDVQPRHFREALARAKKILVK